MILLNWLGGYCSVCSVKPVLLVLPVGILLLILILASLLAFVPELVLLGIRWRLMPCIMT